MGHLLEHIKENFKKRKHGVFDSKKGKDVLALVDETWARAQQEGTGVKVTIQVRNGRLQMDYDVDMGRRVGTNGGWLWQGTEDTERGLL